MSIKLYNGYRATFSDGFDLLRWQYDLAQLRSKMEAEAKAFTLDDLLRRAVFRMDRFHAGLPIEDPQQAHIHRAYKAVEKDCDNLRKGRRSPLFDTEVNLSWKLLSREDREYDTVLCLVYGERPWSEKVIQALALEDYHYQNQTDPPEDMTWEAFQERGEVWEEAFGGDWNNPPAAFFHSFTLSPPPSVPLIGWMPEPPKVPEMDFEQRASDIAFDLLFADLKWSDDRSVWSRVAEVRRECREGGELHGRHQTFIEQVKPKLIQAPTYEDLREKPSEVSSTG